MASVTAVEAKTRFSKLLKRVAHGEEVVITRHDKPVARMIPKSGRSVGNVRKAVAGLLELQREISARTGDRMKLSDAEVRSAIERGRR